MIYSEPHNVVRYPLKNYNKIWIYIQHFCFPKLHWHQKVAYTKIIAGKSDFYIQYGCHSGGGNPLKNLKKNFSAFF